MAKKVVSTIEQFASELPQNKNTSSFVLRMRRIFSSDEELLAFLNRPYMGRQDMTLWERLGSGDEPKLRGMLWDATCELPVLRELQSNDAERGEFLSRPIADMFEMSGLILDYSALSCNGIKTIGDLYNTPRHRFLEIMRGTGRLCASDAEKHADRVEQFFANYPIAGPWPKR